ncbi:MAG: alginate lyase family protein [Chthoniobacteraceae bacterium]
MPDPLLWLIPRKADWPREVLLKAAVEIPIQFNGAAAGTAIVPAGSKVKLVNILEDSVVIDYDGNTTKVPLASTDLKDQAAAALQRANAARKTAQMAAQAPSKQTGAPSPSASPQNTDAENMGPAPEDELTISNGPFVHPGLMHNEEDFKRMRTHFGQEPWASGYKKLLANSHASLGWKQNPQEIVVRGSGPDVRLPQNYPALYHDIAAAYACALRWKISGDPAYAKKSVEIMNVWSSTLKQITGSTDACLAAGIYGYQFANAAEIMRTYRGWKPEDFARFQKMMLDVFYPINKRFLERHNGTKIDHYWANWDLCNMCSMLAIGVLGDKRGLYNDAVRYFKHGAGNGSIRCAVYYVHPGGLGQWQESGRDQGHNTLGISLMGAFCEMAWKQGDDLYGYDNNRFLTGCEYVAKYNLGYDVPYKPYSNCDVKQEIISDNGRGTMRPGWELVYNHYVKRKGLSAPFTKEITEKVRPEGGGGDYGPNSGGFDQLGYGTLTATLDAHVAPQKDTPRTSAHW